MSTRITLHCDRTWRYGSCTSQLLTDAHTIDEARTAAGPRGWRSHPDGTDHCPTCSGHGPQPVDAVVIVLHPEETRP